MAAAIEAFQVGDTITSRSEHHPGGALEVKVVEQVFRRTAPIWHLHVGGQVVRTTGEHPFFAYNKGWVAAGTLRAGDRLLGHDGQWITVEEVYETAEWETVYNLQIADYHTYFVCGWSWGFCVWSHNVTCGLYIAMDDSTPYPLKMYSLYRRADGTKWRFSIGPFAGQTVSQPTVEGVFNFVKSHFVADFWPIRLSTVEWPSLVPGGRTTRANAELERDRLVGGAAGFTTFLRRQVANQTNPAVTYAVRTGARERPAPHVVLDASIHAHHIVVQNDSVRGRAILTSQSVRPAHLILRSVGIDPYFSPANLTWAPNWPNHRNRPEYRNEVYRRLEDVRISQGFTVDRDPTPESVLGRLGERAAVVQELRNIGNEFFNALIPM